MSSQNIHLTSKEYEIMQVLWKAEKPMLISEILGKTKTVAENSIHPMVNSLMKKGFIKVVGNVKVVKTPSRLYDVAISVPEYAVLRCAEVYKTNGKHFDAEEFLNLFVKKSKMKDLREEEIVAGVEKFLSSACEEKAR